MSSSGILTLVVMVIIMSVVVVVSMMVYVRLCLVGVHNAVNEPCNKGCSVMNEVQLLPRLQILPAQEKIREIEEGVAPIRTSLLEDQDEIIKEIKRLNNSASRLSICSAFGGMEMSYNYLFDSYKRIVDIYRKGK